MWRLQKWWSLVTLGCTGAPKGIWSLAYNEGNHQLRSPNFVDNWPIFTMKVDIPIIFPSENYFLVCIFMAKYFSIKLKVLWLSFLWQDVATDYVRPKTNRKPEEALVYRYLSLIHAIMNHSSGLIFKPITSNHAMGAWEWVIQLQDLRVFYVCLWLTYISDVSK